MREKVELLNAQIEICENMIETLKRLEEKNKKDHFVKGYDAILA